MRRSSSVSKAPTRATQDRRTPVKPAAPPPNGPRKSTAGLPSAVAAAASASAVGKKPSTPPADKADAKPKKLTLAEAFAKLGSITTQVLADEYITSARQTGESLNELVVTGDGVSTGDDGALRVSGVGDTTYTFLDANRALSADAAWVPVETPAGVMPLPSAADGLALQPKTEVSLGLGVRAKLTVMADGGEMLECDELRCVRSASGEVDVMAPPGAVTPLVSLQKTLLKTPFLQCQVGESTGGFTALPSGRCTITAGPDAPKSLADLRYVGDVRDGLPNGQGELTTGGHVFSGQWVKGALSCDKGEHRQGTTVLYAGGFRAGLRHGKGEVSLASSSSASTPLTSGLFAEVNFEAGAIVGDEITVILRSEKTKGGTSAATLNRRTGEVTVSLSTGTFTGAFGSRTEKPLSSADSTSIAAAAEIALGSSGDLAVVSAPATFGELAKAHGAAALAAVSLSEAPSGHAKAALLLGAAARGRLASAAAVGVSAAKQKDVAAVKDKIDEAKRSAATAEKLDRAIAEHKKKLAALESAKAAVETKTGATEREIARLEDEVEELRAKLRGTAGDDASPESPSKTKAQINAMQERLSMATKRMNAATANLKTMQGVIAATQKRIDAQRALTADLAKQQLAADEALSQAEANEKKSYEQFDAKLVDEQAAHDSRKLEVDEAAAALESQKAALTQLEAKLARLRDPEAGDERVDDAKAALDNSRAMLAGAEAALEEQRNERDKHAMRLADLHRVETEAIRQVAALKAASEAEREKLRRKRKDAEAAEEAADEAERELRTRQGQIDPLNDNEDEATMRAKHARCVATFVTRKGKAQDALEAALKVRKQVQVELDKANASRADAAAALASEDKTPTPPPTRADPRVAELERQLAETNAAIDQTGADSKRLKSWKGGPPCLSLNVTELSAAQLKALQSKLRESIADADATLARLKKEALAAKSAADDRRRVADAKKPKVPRDAGTDWYLKTLQEQLEKRDTRIAELKMQAARIKQLEAKLAVTSDTVSGMHASAGLRQQQSLSKQQSDQAWASARNTAVRRDSMGLSRSMSGSHF